MIATIPEGSNTVGLAKYYPVIKNRSHKKQPIGVLARGMCPIMFYQERSKSFCSKIVEFEKYDEIPDEK